MGYNEKVTATHSLCFFSGLHEERQRVCACVRERQGVSTSRVGPCTLRLSSHSPEVPESPSGRKYFAKHHPKREGGFSSVESHVRYTSGAWGTEVRIRISSRASTHSAGMMQLLLPLALKSLYLQEHFLYLFEMSLQQPRRRIQAFCCCLCLPALPSKL